MGRGKRNGQARRGVLPSSTKASTLVAPVTPADVLVSQSDHRAVRVTPGLLDERAVVAFGRGQCHALALALHDLTGYPLAVYEDDEADPVHVFVITPDGRALDAGGALAVDEHQELWSGAYLERYSRDRVASLHEDGTWREPELALAEGFATAVLARLQAGPEYLHPDDLEVASEREPLMRVVGREGEYRLRPGVLDDEARAAFHDGQAHALAMSLSLTTKGPIVFLYDEDDEPQGAYLVLEDGRLLDCDGPSSRAEVESRGRLEQVRYRQVREAEDWPAPDLAAAETFVGAVLALAG